MLNEDGKIKAKMIFESLGVTILYKTEEFICIYVCAKDLTVHQGLMENNLCLGVKM